MYLARLLLVAAVAATILSSPSAVDAAGLETAIAQSQQTGLPLFVMGTTESCGYCKQLKQRLSTEAELKPLIAQYIPLELNVSDPDFRAWSQKYKPAGNGVPMVFIVSSTGEEIHNSSGAPQGDGLKRLLMQGIQKTGGFKDLKALAADIGKLTQAIVKAKSQLERGDRDDALRTLYPYLKEWETVKNSPSPSGKELVALVEPLLTEGQAKLEEAQSQTAVKDRELLGLVTLMGVKRTYDNLPPMAAKIEAAIEEAKEKPELEPLVAQAVLIDKARSYDEANSTTAAIAAYGRVAERFPNTLAANLSQLRASQLAAQKQTAAVAATEELSIADRRKRAQSYLRMAATFASSRPTKSQDYLQQALEIAPKNSPEAIKALRELKK